jgi:site-specific recombinase XerD
MSRSIHAAQAESFPYNHHLHQFLTFLKHERGFADATIVNRERSLRPFLGWLVAEDVPLSTVSPVVITKYFTKSHNSVFPRESGNRCAAALFARCRGERTWARSQTTNGQP